MVYHSQSMEWDLAETTECSKARDFHPIGPDCGMTEESVLLGPSVIQLRSFPAAINCQSVTVSRETLVTNRTSQKKKKIRRCTPEHCVGP